MTIYGICGDIGSGKSFYQLRFALDMCNKRQKRLLTNFGLNVPEIKKYAAMMGYGWVMWLCEQGQIATVNLGESADAGAKKPLSYFLNPELYSDSIALLDEAGIFLNSRDYSKTPKSLLQDLAQSRKSGIDLIYCSQNDKQVDLQFRMLTQFFVHCAGLSKYDRAMKRPKLHWKCYYHFTSSQYWMWAENHKVRSNPLRSALAATHSQWGPMTAADRQLFNCFDSFTRLESQGQHDKYFDTRQPRPEIDSLRCALLARKQYDHFRRMETDYNYLLGRSISEIKSYFKYRRSYS